MIANRPPQGCVRRIAMAFGIPPLAFRRSRGRLSALGQAVGVAAALLVGLLVFLSVNPEAHEYFHHDANHGSHGCVVTEFAAGGAYALTPMVVVKPAAQAVWAMAA